MNKKAAWLNFVREQLNKPEALLKSILWRDESKIELFHQNQNCYLWRKINIAYQAKNMIPMEKHSGRNFKIRDCFFTCEPEWIYISHENINSQSYQ